MASWLCRQSIACDLPEPAADYGGWHIAFLPPSSPEIAELAWTIDRLKISLKRYTEDAADKMLADSV